MTAKEVYKLLRSKKSSSNEQLLNKLQVYTKDQVTMDYSTDIRELSASSSKLSGTGGIKTFITGRDKLTYDFIDLDLYYIRDEVDDLLDKEKEEREEADTDLQKQLDEETENRENADQKIVDWSKTHFVDTIIATGEAPLTLEASCEDSDGYKEYTISGSVDCYSKGEIDDMLKDLEDDIKGEIPSNAVSSVTAESGSDILVADSPKEATSGDVTVKYSVDEDALEEWLKNRGFDPGSVDSGVTSVIAKNLGEDDDTQAILKLSPLSRDDSDATGAATIGIGVDKDALNTWINKYIDVTTGVTSIEVTSNTLNVTPTGGQTGNVSINLEYTGGGSGGAVDSVLIQHLANDNTGILTINPTTAQTGAVVFDLGIDEDALKKYITELSSETVDLLNYYTKKEVDELLNNYYTKDETYTREEIEYFIAQAKLDPTEVDLSNYYTKSQVNSLLNDYVKISDLSDSTGTYLIEDIKGSEAEDDHNVEITVQHTQPEDNGELYGYIYTIQGNVDLSDYAKIKDLSGEYVQKITGTPPVDDEYTFNTDLAFVSVVATANPPAPDGSAIQGVNYEIGAFVYLPGYYTKTEVDELLDSYYTKSEVDELLENAAIGDIDLTDYVKIGDICPRAVGQAESYLVSSLSSIKDETHNVEFDIYMSTPPPPPCEEDEECTPILWAKEYVISANVDLSNYYTQEEVRELIAEYVKKSDIYGKVVTSLSSADSGNVTISILTVPPPPESDTIEGIDYTISANVNLSDYYTIEQVDDLLSNIGGGTTYKYYTEDSVSGSYPSAQIDCDAGNNHVLFQILANPTSSSNTYLLATVSSSSSSKTIKLDPTGFYYDDCEVATQCWVLELVDEKITGGTVDLSNYYTKQEIDDMLATIESGFSGYKLYSETSSSATIETPNVGYGTISTVWNGGTGSTMTITTDLGSTVMHGNYIRVTGSNGSSGSITIDGNKVLTEADFSKDDISNLLEYYDYNNSIATSISDTKSNVHILEVNGAGNTSYFTLNGSNVPVGREMYWIIHNTGTGTQTYQFGRLASYNHICVDGNDTLTIQPGEYGEFSMISDGTNGYIRSASQS